MSTIVSTELRYLFAKKDKILLLLQDKLKDCNVNCANLN